MRFAPAHGLTVRDPRTRIVIPPEGVKVGPHDFDLHRMRAQGDLVEVTETPPPATSAEKDD